MRHLEQMLSPVIKNRAGVVAQNLDKDELILLDRIRQQKLDLLEKRITPSQIDIVRPEIVASWLRSHSYGLDPFDFVYGPTLDQSAFEELLREKGSIIQAADPYISQLEIMLSGNNYLILLTDEQGVILRLGTGNDTILRQIEERFSLTPGTVWTEETVGTVSHVMSLSLGSPIQLCGPEMYSETCSQVMGLILGSPLQAALEQNTETCNQTSCSSAPIYDGNSSLVGSITIISPYLYHQNPHSLGLTVSTAWAIQNHLRLTLPPKKPERSRRMGGVPNSLKARYTFDSIIGHDPTLLKTIEQVKKYARLESNLLVQGESGTGKEVFAQAVHNETRPYGPFIAVNCAAIPRTLIESELFGYVGGAFTGAGRQGSPGKIEMAHGGTLFLDEIGDMPLELQSVLLRVIEEKVVMRVGGSHYIPVEFRLITATNKDLTALVEKQQFRQDLYYRLAVLDIQIPPLRERGTDIITLAEHFIEMTAVKQRIPAPVLSESAMYLLMRFRWPGNIRQLENIILRAVNTSRDGIIKPEDLSPEISRPSNSGSVLPSIRQTSTRADHELLLTDIEKITILKALLQSGNNISKAAIMLGMSKSTLYRRINKYQLLSTIRADK